VFRPVHHHAENETIAAAISEPALAEAANCRGEGKAAAVGGFFYHVGCWQILLQKSQKAQRLIFRQRTKQATIADQ
jgi:hypothetical protein